MKLILIYLMIFGGSALMVYNIYRYVRFYRHIQKNSNWGRGSRVFNIPIVLLVLFLAGYLTVGFFGNPDIVMAGILFGGSIFVFVMLYLIQLATDRIQESERLEARLSAAEEANKAKTFFLSNMSHDIRTPLNAIIGYTTLADKDGVSAEETKTYIKKIDTAGHQLLDIVNDVLEMSRIENGKVDIEPIPMDLQKCVEDAVDLAKPQFAEKELVFSVNCEVSHRHVLCDKNQLNRALMNLLGNAGKFTERGSIEVALEEHPGDGETGSYEIRIKDTGIGMSDQFVEDLFTPFERERTSTVSKIQGTGLGMAITKNIIDLMGGEISVDTEQGKGTEFTILLSLPIVEEDEEADTETFEKIRFDGFRALLVEDNQVNMEIARIFLQQAGFIVETAVNGKQAVDIVAASEDGHYDVVLMDIQMPVMDGYDATRHIRELPGEYAKALPIIAMSANAYEEDIRKSFDSGMNGHIAKPFDPQDLAREINEQIRGKAIGDSFQNGGNNA